jgi:hypothetical protein
MAARKKTPAKKASPVERVERALAKLGDDFNVFSAQRKPPSETAIRAAEKAIGRRLPSPYRELVAHFGPLAIEVDAKVWPRPEPFDVRPAWQMDFGLAMFGVASGGPPALDVVTQKSELARADQSILPVLRRVLGSGDVYGFDEEDRFVLYAHDTGEAEPAGDLVDVLLGEIERLQEDRERLRTEPIATRDPDAPPADLRMRKVRSFSVPNEPAAILSALRELVIRLRAQHAAITVRAEHDDGDFDLERDPLPASFLDGSDGVDITLTYDTSGPLPDTFEVFVTPWETTCSAMIRTLEDPSTNEVARRAVEAFVAAFAAAGLTLQPD